MAVNVLALFGHKGENFSTRDSPSLVIWLPWLYRASGCSAVVLLGDCLMPCKELLSHINIILNSSLALSVWGELHYFVSMQLACWSPVAQAVLPLNE